MQIITLSPIDGKLIEIKTLPGAAPATPEDYEVVTSPDTEQPLLVWAQGDHVQTLPLPSSLEVGKPEKLPGFIGVVENQLLASKGFFIGLLPENAAAIFKVEAKGPRKLWDFASPVRGPIYCLNCPLIFLLGQK